MPRRLTTGLLLVAVTAVSAQAARLKPVDEGPRDASFAAFRKELLAACERKDWNAIQRVLDPRVRSSFGADGGIAGFKKSWSPEKPGSKLYAALAEVLRLGGSFDKEGKTPGFTAPYVYTSFPEKLDSFENVCVTVEDAPIRQRPNATSAVIDHASYDILRLVPEKSPTPEGWRHVRAPNGKPGYIQRSQARSPVDYRANFQKLKGEWKLTFLVAGD